VTTDTNRKGEIECIIQKEVRSVVLNGKRDALIVRGKAAKMERHVRVAVGVAQSRGTRPQFGLEQNTTELFGILRETNGLSSLRIQYRTL